MEDSGRVRVRRGRSAPAQAGHDELVLALGRGGDVLDQLQPDADGGAQPQPQLVAHALASSGGAPRLAVAGGSAGAVLAPLRATLTDDRWQRLRVTWVDERRVPSDSTDSNRGEAYRRGWLGPGAPVGLEVPLWLDRETPTDAVRRVTRALTEHFEGGLDVLLLGMGEDGHTASLFPGQEVRPGPLVMAVHEAPKPPPDRVSLTPSALCRTRRMVVMVTGAAKRPAMARWQAGEGLPVARVASGGSALVLLDRAATPAGD